MRNLNERLRSIPPLAWAVIVFPAGVFSFTAMAFEDPQLSTGLTVLAALIGYVLHMWLESRPEPPPVRETTCAFAGCQNSVPPWLLFCHHHEEGAFK